MIRISFFVRESIVFCRILLFFVSEFVQYNSFFERLESRCKKLNKDH